QADGVPEDLDHREGDGDVSRPRFYRGQPVVCIWSREQWEPVHPRLVPYIPVKGRQYVISDIQTHPDGMVLVWVTATPGVWYDQDGFAPVTDGTVRDIMRKALDNPAPRVREKERA